MWIIRALLIIILIMILLGFSVYNAEERVAVNIIKTRYINVPLIFVAYWAFVFVCSLCHSLSQAIRRNSPV
jgi:uncharacterized integral membrane protein